MTKYRLCYSKCGSLRYISHLDLMRAFERALRRAELPVAYTEGFHPHPQMGLGPALPLGIESTAEYLDLVLKESMDPNELETRLNEVLPPELAVSKIIILSQHAKPLTAVINRATYTYYEMHGFDPKGLTQRMEELWSRAELLITRRSKDKGEKEVNIRPLWHGWKVVNDNEGSRLEAEFEIGSGGTVRPDELCKFLPDEMIVDRIIRSGLWIVNEKGRHLPTDFI